MPTPDPRAHQVLASVSRVAVLEILQRAATPLGVQDLADRTGLHPNTVRGHLERLVEFGHVVQSTDGVRRPGRPRRLYTAAPENADPENADPDTAGPADGASAAPAGPQRGVRLLADVLARYLATTEDPHGAALEVGLLVSRRLAASGPAADGPGGEHPSGPSLQRVLALLDDLGFRPQPASDGTGILLRSCPFHEAAHGQSDLACSIHLGLLRGALQRLGAPAEATRLVPPGRPEACVLQVSFGRPSAD